MKIRHILDIADECIVKYTASEEWVFTTEELKKFSLAIIKECISCSDESSQFNICKKFNLDD